VKQGRKKIISGFAKVICKSPIQCIGKNMLRIKNNSLLFTKDDSVVPFDSNGGSHIYSKQKVMSGLCSAMHGTCVDIFLKSVGTDFAYFAQG